MAQKPETNFRKRVRADLTELVQRGEPLFFEAIQQKAIKGSPDYVLCVAGLFVALELKDTKGAVSPIQEAKLEGIGRAEGIGLVVTPGGWSSVLDFIKDILKEKYDNQRTNESTH